jgi:hypothetical protein
MHVFEYTCDFIDICWVLGMNHEIKYDLTLDFSLHLEPNLNSYCSCAILQYKSSLTSFNIVSHHFHWGL